MAKTNKKRLITPSAHKDVGGLDFSHSAGRMQNGTATLENTQAESYKPRQILINLSTYHLAQQSHAWLFTQAEWKGNALTTKTPIHECLQQRYTQQ